MLNKRNVAITIKTLFILLKIFKVLIPALCKLDGSYVDSNVWILKYCYKSALIPTDYNN
jgi:hypothetical protein